MSTISGLSQSTTVTSSDTSAASLRLTQKTDDSSLSVRTSVEDYLPQTRVKDPDKKEFKNYKDYIAYMMLLLQKIGKVTPPEGRQFVRIEDRNTLMKLEKQLNNMSLTK